MHMSISRSLFCYQHLRLKNWKTEVNVSQHKQRWTTTIEDIVGSQDRFDHTQTLLKGGDFSLDILSQLLDYLYDMPTLLRHLMQELFSVNGLVWMFRIRIILCLFAALLYLLLPFDLLPEAVFGILGYLDDILVVLLLTVYVTVIYRNFVANR